MRDSSGEGGFRDNLAHTRTLLALDACHQPNHEVRFMRLASTPTWEAETRDQSPVCCCCLRPVLSRCLCPMFTRVTLSPEWLHTTLRPLTHVLTGLEVYLTSRMLRCSSVRNVAYENICPPRPFRKWIRTRSLTNEIGYRCPRQFIPMILQSILQASQIK